MKPYKKHAPSEIPLRICYKKTENGDKRTQGKRRKTSRSLSTSTETRPNGKQRDTETEIGEGNIEEPDQRKTS